MSVTKAPYVEIYAQGSEEAVEEFISDIQNRAAETGCNFENKCRKYRNAGAVYAV